MSRGLVKLDHTALQSASERSVEKKSSSPLERHSAWGFAMAKGIREARGNIPWRRERMKTISGNGSRMEAGDEVFRHDEVFLSLTDQLSGQFQAISQIFRRDVTIRCQAFSVRGWSL